MGNLPIHMNNNEHYVIVYTVIKEYAQRIKGSHTIVFKSLHFAPFTLKRNSGFFELKWGLQHFQKSPFSRVENARVV